MDHAEIKDLFRYLESNREFLNRIQNEFIINVKKNYRWTGIITTGQVESLNNIKERIPSAVESQVS